MRPCTLYLTKLRLRYAQRDICFHHNSRFKDDDLGCSSLRTVAKTPNIITSIFAWSWLVGWSQNKGIAQHLLQMALG